MNRHKSFFGSLILLALIILLLLAVTFIIRAPQTPFLQSNAENLPLPAFVLSSLWQPDQMITENTIPTGQVSLLHIWGSWCSACRHEHAMMMKISQAKQLPIYSFDYKDDPAAAKAWLQHAGNPYTLTASDQHGQISRQLGVYGTPVTFLIDKHRVIRYRHVGLIDDDAWEHEIFPLILSYQKAN